jgi:ParB family chromosome partitioning protein
MNLPSLDSLFTTQEERDNAKNEQVINIPIELIHDFPEHPFKVVHNNDMERLIESIKVSGVLYPTIVRQKDDGSYEMISGHRRKYAAKEAGLKELKCIVKNLTDDEATILMVDSNIQREEILPSEKAFAYKMKLDAMKHQGKFITSAPMEQKQTSREILAEEVGESASNIQRYIRLTNLIPNLLDLVDEKRIGLRPAVEISYICKDNQELLYDIFKYDESTPTLSQAQLLRKLDENGELTDEKLEEIMRQEKPNQKEQFKTSYDDIRHYFPKNYSNEQINNKIMELLERFQKEWKQKIRDSR